MIRPPVTDNNTVQAPLRMGELSHVQDSTSRNLHVTLVFLLFLVFGSPVTGPEKDRDQTGPQIIKTDEDRNHGPVNGPLWI